jgi:pimeloyl-ACP methyl ester carboxylesterase
MDNCRSYHYFAPQLQTRVTTMLGHNDDDNDDIVSMEIAAIDLPGHGWSSHKSSDAPPVHITDYVYYLAEAISQLPWSTTTTGTNGSTNGEHEMHDHESNGAENDDQDNNSNNNHGIVLVGHSMGAAICCMYAAAFPEQVYKLVLLEGGTFHSDSMTFSFLARNLFIIY